jgi:Icc-related predicted phosphoesterase
MKIQITSDLHLEFRDPIQLENAGADVLVLGGDIFLAEHFYRNPRTVTRPDGTVVDADTLIQNGGYREDVRKWRGFLNHCSQNWDHVVYVMGNHEHYKGRWERNEGVLREELLAYPNIHLLEQGRLVVGDVQILGASLWTDMNNYDPLTILSARDMMNDYRSTGHLVEGSFRKLSPKVTVAKHTETRQWLRHMLSEHRMKTVVCTHHAPSRQSIHPQYANDHLMNGCFASNCEDIMMDHEHLLLWTHGHVHNPWDYQVEHCRVVCNPCGYPGEKTQFNPNLVIEI